MEQSVLDSISLAIEHLHQAKAMYETGDVENAHLELTEAGEELVNAKAIVKGELK